MPAYQLVFAPSAVVDIKKLDRVVQKRLAKKLVQFAQDPLSFSKKIHDPMLGGYRFRIGDYRVIFDFDGHKIVVLKIGHRREIYR